MILTGVIDDLHRTIGEIPEGNDEKVAEGKDLVSKVVALKHDLEHDRPLEYLPEDDALLGDDISYYNKKLQEQPKDHKSWLTGAWLFTECYMYRLLATFFASTRHWKTYDVFQRQKDETFQASIKAVGELCKRYKVLNKQLEESTIPDHALYVLFREFTDISLWGNATDLSLLTNISLEDIQALQGADIRKQNEKNVIANDIDQAWEAINVKKGGRVDIILDNAGFELFTDLIYGLFLLDSNLADTVVFHPKDIPWFVSDVLPVDLENIVKQVQDPSFFSETVPDMDYFAQKLSAYYKNGNITVHTSPFWTSPAPFWEIREGGEAGGDKVQKDLVNSKLVILKGDLNHRKLLFDLAWPKTTPFITAIQSAASNNVNLLTLRTCKADTCSGLPEGKEEELEKEWQALGYEDPRSWVYYGKYAVVQYSSGKN